MPGNVYHVDALVHESDVAFAEAHGYVRPPFDVMHGGGIFSSRTLRRDSEAAVQCRDLTRTLIDALGMVRGAVHTEFIERTDGTFCFLETAARVGGAHIAELVEAATGINLWSEWAQIEIADARDEAYALPAAQQEYAGILISLSRQEHPNLSAYQDEEIAWRMTKKHHAGLIISSPDYDRVEALLHTYMDRFREEFQAWLPAPETAEDM